MTLLDTLKGLFDGEDRTFRYRCTNCETEFESNHADMSRVSCPECSGARVRSVVTDGSEN